jgi:hypothetical protein
MPYRHGRGVVEIRAEGGKRWSDFFEGRCCVKDLDDLSEDVCIEGECQGGQEQALVSAIMQL